MREGKFAYKDFGLNVKITLKYETILKYVWLD